MLEMLSLFYKLFKKIYSLNRRIFNKIYVIIIFKKFNFLEIIMF